MQASQQFPSYAPSPASAPKAGFWLRVVAFLIDGFLLGIIQTILASALNLSLNGRGGLGTVISLAYFTFFWSSVSPWPGQTVGSKLLNIRVVKTDGSALSLVNAFIRYVGFYISVLVVFLGLIWVAFDANKQGWHDKIAGTYVIRAS